MYSFTYLVTTFLKSSNNVTNETTLNTIWFDCQEGALTVSSGYSLDRNGIALDGKFVGVVILVRHHGSCTNKSNASKFGCSRRSGGGTDGHGLQIVSAKIDDNGEIRNSNRQVRFDIDIMPTYRYPTTSGGSTCGFGRDGTGSAGEHGGTTELDLRKNGREKMLAHPVIGSNRGNDRRM